MRRKAVHYRVANNYYEAELITAVNGLLSQGYEPIGSIVVIESQTGRHYRQTMVKYEYEDKPVSGSYANVKLVYDENGKQIGHLDHNDMFWRWKP